MLGLGYATALTGLVVLTGAGAFVLAEPGKDYFDGVYWALQTVTKLGYGDQPITTDRREGRDDVADDRRRRVLRRADRRAGRAV